MSFALFVCNEGKIVPRMGRGSFSPYMGFIETGRRTRVRRVKAGDGATAGAERKGKILAEFAEPVR